MAYKLFFCYAREDEELLHKLMAHLKPLQLDGLIDQFWYDGDISPGSEWEPELFRQLQSANIILLLISSAFMASDYCYTKELRQAIERHERKEARVIPIILSPVYWQINPLNKLQALPKGGKPITGPAWHSVDGAMENVAKCISSTIKEMQKKPVAQYRTLQRYVAEQVSQGKKFSEALQHLDPDMLDLFTTFLAEYVHKDASLEVRLEKLLIEVSAVGDKDLRVQAEVTADVLGVVADCINYLICELAKVVINVQKTTAQEIATSNQMLTVLQQEVQRLEGIAEVVLVSDDSNTRKNLATPMFDMYKSTKALKEETERIRDLSNRLYTSVSPFLLPPEESLYWGQ